MRYEVLLAAEAAEDLQELPAHLRSEVRDAMEAHLRHEPERTSRSRIKRLRGLSRPQYRLRVGEMRVFYDFETCPPLRFSNHVLDEPVMGALFEPFQRAGLAERQGFLDAVLADRETVDEAFLEGPPAPIG